MNIKIKAKIIKLIGMCILAYSYWLNTIMAFDSAYFLAIMGTTLLVMNTASQKD